ncbi:MAG: hypothetical protein ACR2IT_07460, partial [Pirellulales bacterium]
MKLFRKKGEPISQQWGIAFAKLVKAGVLFCEIRDGLSFENLFSRAKTRQSPFFKEIGTLFATVSD